jgi:hypothetical protein
MSARVASSVMVAVNIAAFVRRAPAGSAAQRRGRAPVRHWLSWLTVG